MPDLSRFKAIDESMEAKKKKLGGGDISDFGTRLANALLTAGLTYATSGLAPGIIGEGLKAVGVGKPIVEGVAKIAGLPEKKLGMEQAKLDIPEFKQLGEIREGGYDFGEMFKPSAATVLPAIKTGAKALAEPRLDLGKAAGYALETGIAPTAEKVQRGLYERAAEAADLIPKTMKKGEITYGRPGLTEEQASALIATGEYEPADFKAGEVKYKRKKPPKEETAAQKRAAQARADKQEYEATRDALSGAITNLVNTLPVSGEGRDIAIGKLKEWEKLADGSGLPSEHIRKLKDQIRKAQNTVEDILAEEEISIYGEPKEKGFFRKSTVGTLEGF